MHGAWNMIGCRITHQITHLLRRTIHPCPVPFCSVVACLLCLPFVQLRTVQILQNEDGADDIFDTSFTVFQLQSLRFFPTKNESTCNISKEQRPMVLMSMQQFLQVDDLVSQDAAMLRSRAEIPALQCHGTNVGRAHGPRRYPIQPVRSQLGSLWKCRPFHSFCGAVAVKLHSQHFEKPCAIPNTQRVQLHFLARAFPCISP